jgi:ABC-type sugar transport system substrate-binding protein
MRLSLSLLIRVLLCTLISSPCIAAAKTNPHPHVLYMSPSQVDDPFDKHVVALMRAAANDLDIKLTVVNVVKNQIYNQQRLDNILRLEPDYLVLSYQIYTHKVVEQAKHLGIKVMIINSPIPGDDRRLMGLPREKFSNWIGHMYPDDYLAGHQLTQLLHQKVHYAANLDPTRPDELLAFNGHRSTTSAKERKRGLMDAALELDIHIRHIFAADWDPDITTRPLPSAVKRFPDAKLFWAASDAIALRIIEHQKALNHIAGKDFYTAGIDWSEPGLKSVQKGEMVASIGGHFLMGAWVMVQIYDYHNGLDFADFGTETLVPMVVADQSNAEYIHAVLQAQRWDDIDFKSYSRQQQKAFTPYNFNVDKVFGGMPISNEIR